MPGESDQDLRQRAEKTRITIRATNSSPREVIRLVAATAGIDIAYVSSYVPDDTDITIDLPDVTVYSILSGLGEKYDFVVQPWYRDGSYLLAPSGWNLPTYGEK